MKSAICGYKTKMDAEDMYETLLKQEAHYADLLTESQVDMPCEYPVPAFRDVPKMEQDKRNLRFQIQSYTDVIYEMRDILEKDESIEWIDFDKMQEASERWPLYEADCCTSSMLDWLRMVDGVTMRKVQEEKDLLWAGLSAPNGFCLGLVYGFVERWPLSEGEKIMLLHKIVSHRKDIEKYHFEVGEAAGWALGKHRDLLEASAAA